MTVDINAIQIRRAQVEKDILSSRSQLQRNKMGQFGTPPALAGEILEYANGQLPANANIRFLDPAFGTGVFFGALLEVFESKRIARAYGYELDPVLGRAAFELWASLGLDLRIEDFTRAVAPPCEGEKANLIICNPPYVRHHHLSRNDKDRLRELSRTATGIEFNGLTGLYCYFVALSHAWMADGALAGWLIPGEFLDVNYGMKLKKYLLDRVCLLRIHRFDPEDVQFEDALVSSTVVWFEKRPPPHNSTVEFSYGGTLAKPDVVQRVSTQMLRRERKWSRYPLREPREPVNQEAGPLSELFTITRGIATGANNFFVMTKANAKENGIPDRFLIPILPSPRRLRTSEVHADAEGIPQLDEQLFLLKCGLGEEDVKKSYPNLWKYFERGMLDHIDQRYLCKSRVPWYTQEQRRPPPYLFTYMGRTNGGTKKPMRFILNESQAIATNSYLLLYPKPSLEKIIHSKPDLQKEIWVALNAMSTAEVVSHGRVYGGGLHKLEPKELGRVSAQKVREVVGQIKEDRQSRLL